MKPLMLLDIDGVLNVDHPGRWGGKLERGRASDDSNIYDMKWASGIMDRISGLREWTDIQWCTTWCGHTQQFGAIWGLCLADAFTTPPGKYVGDLKLNAARRTIMEGRRLIWVDDTEAPQNGSRLRSEMEEAGAMIIRPRSRFGLQPEHITKIEEFIRSDS